MPISCADKILCVDDEDNILQMFRRTLGREFNLYLANSAEAALNLLSEHADFAVILSDYNMPGLNGVEFMKIARTLSPDTVLIMLTGNIELDIVIKTINETDIFRYIPKPCPMEVMRKIIIDALEQYHLIIGKQLLTEKLAQTNLQLSLSNATLAKQKHLLEHELEMAKIVYGKVHQYGHDEPDGLDYFIAAKESVGGDFLLTHTSKAGGAYYVMLGDITGHGLQSALAVLLVTEIFDVLCNSQPDLETLAQNINDKMCRKLPPGLFCAALLLKLDLDNDHLYIWQGGMPEAYLLDTQGRVIDVINSTNLPLGIITDPAYSQKVSCHAINSATSLFAYSDGVTEQIDHNHSMFGNEHLQAALLDTPPNTRRTDRVVAKLRAHQGDQAQCDDISLFELNFSRIRKALE